MRNTIKHACKEDLHPSSIIVHFMVMVSHAMILAIGLLTIGHVQGMQIILVEDISLFLYSLATLYVLCVKVLAIRPRIASFPYVSGDRFREKRTCKVNHIRRKRLSR